MSYGFDGSAGTSSSSAASARSARSFVGSRGGSSRLFWGRNASSARSPSRHAGSSGNTRCATPERIVAAAPPSSSFVTSSCVTARMTSGPVMNMWLDDSTMNTKSVIAGEYTAPPAHGPSTADSWGTTPDASVLRRKMSA